MDLDQLIAGLGIRRISAMVRPRPGADAAHLPVRVCDITEDSRTVMPGSLFIARKGERSDGRAFVNSAVSAGAIAVLTDDPNLRLPAPGGKGHTQDHAELLLTEDLPRCIASLAERFYGEASTKLAVVGVTGTNGKTTITWLIHRMLNTAGLRCGLMGTVCVDDGSEIAPASLTTPPALEVSRTMARMLECGCVACAMEASSHALDQRRVGAVKFRLAVFTNFTHDHLDYHKTMEAYADAKAMLFENLPPANDKPGQGGVAIVNSDDPCTPRMLRDCTARVVRCSMRSRHSASEAPADWFGAVRSVNLAGMHCTIASPVGTWEIKLPLIGAHNLMNAMQAAAAAVEMGVPGEQIPALLEQAVAPPGRLELVTRFDDPLAVYVDYAHTDDALRRVLSVGRNVLDQQPASSKGRLWVVFGCGGDRDRTKRPKMGAAACELADRVVITSDNPRREEPDAIIQEILAGIDPSKRARATIEPDREKAIRLAITEAAAGDLIIIAGKGHEDYQILPDGKGGTHKVHFDDREHARAALLLRSDIRRDHLDADQTGATISASIVTPAQRTRTVALKTHAAPPGSDAPAKVLRHGSSPGHEPPAKGKSKPSDPPSSPSPPTDENKDKHKGHRP